MLLTPYNQEELAEYIQESSDLGIKRVVLRKLKGRDHEYPVERTFFKDMKKTGDVFGWPIYKINGLEITVCGFDKSTAKGLFLFSDGKLQEYLVK